MKKQFIGTEVTHVHWGTGTIVAFENRRIEIEFRTENQKRALFCFPDAFCGEFPYLCSNHPILSDYIRDYIEEMNTCVLCKKVILKPNILNAQKLCEKCAKCAYSCESCGRLVDPRTTSNSEYGLCKACFDRMYFKCSSCHDIYEKELMPSICNPYATEEIWCADCACDKGYHSCDGCEKLFPDAQLVSLDYSSFCPTCFQSQTHVCECCGVRYILGSWDTDEHFCFICYRRKKYIESILTKDFAAFKVKKITPRRLAQMQTLPLMTMLSTPLGYRNQNGEEEEYCDAVLIESHDKALVLVHNTSFPVDLSGKCYGEATMTELKQHKLSYRILAEDHELLMTIPWSSESMFEVWQRPFLIKASTYYDRDFRKEWHGDNMVYEGNNYGDTTEFLIVGVVRKNDSSKF